MVKPEQTEDFLDDLEYLLDGMNKRRLSPIKERVRFFNTTGLKMMEKYDIKRFTEYMAKRKAKT